MDIHSHITSKATMDAQTDYEQGKVSAYKSMIIIYSFLQKYYDRTRQSIYFFAYTKKTCNRRRLEEGEHARGEADAFEEVFNHFRPKRKQ